VGVLPVPARPAANPAVAADSAGARKSFQQQAGGWGFGVLLASQAEDPGQESSYWFYMAALGGVSGDLLCSRSREFRLSLDP
jgi:hypothetical protein